MTFLTLSSYLFLFFSFFLLYLKAKGPQEADGQELLGIVNDLPIESQELISRCDGILPFLLLSEDFAAVDNVVCLNCDVKKAQNIVLNNLRHHFSTELVSSEKRLFSAITSTANVRQSARTISQTTENSDKYSYQNQINSQDEDEGCSDDYESLPESYEEDPKPPTYSYNQVDDIEVDRNIYNKFGGKQKFQEVSIKFLLMYHSFIILFFFINQT